MTELGYAVIALLALAIGYIAIVRPLSTATGITGGAVAGAIFKSLVLLPLTGLALAVNHDWHGDWVRGFRREVLRVQADRWTPPPQTCPSEADGVFVQQRRLEQICTGCWRVDRVEVLSTESGRPEGGWPARCRATARVHVALLRPVRGFDPLVLAENLWVSDLGGDAGTSRTSRAITMLWRQTDQGTWIYEGTAIQ